MIVYIEQQKNNMNLLIQGLQTTVEVTATAVIAGLCIGTCLALIRTLQTPVLDFLAKVYINIFRSQPLVMVLLAFYLAAPELIRRLFNIDGDIRLACALVAFTLFEAAFFAEIIRSGIRAIPAHQFMACKAVGFSTFQTYHEVIIPQAIKNSLPVLITQSIILFQDTALVYIIGLTDFFGSAVKLGEMNGNITQMILIASVGYLSICVALQRLSNKITTRSFK